MLSTYRPLPDGTKPNRTADGFQFGEGGREPRSHTATRPAVAPRWPGHYGSELPSWTLPFADISAAAERRGGTATITRWAPLCAGHTAAGGFFEQPVDL